MKVDGFMLGPFVMAFWYFIFAGTFNNINSVIYFSLMIITFLIGFSILINHNPTLIKHRAEWKNKQNAKNWDCPILLWLGIIGFNLAPIVAGLETRFFGVYNNSYFIVTGFILLVLSTIFILWPMFVNTHFETTVRIQKDRKHKVISSGPYKIVRHPGYVGVILGLFSLSFALGTLWSFIPVTIACGILVYRTHLEDKTLRNELEGYEEYARNTTRYRLLPGVY